MTKHEPWCQCCTNEATVNAAVEVAKMALQKFYCQPMCVGSMTTVMAMATDMIGTLASAALAGHALKETGMPEALYPLLFESARERSTDDVANAVKELYADAEKYHYDGAIRTVEKTMHSIRELQKADAAFDASKPT